VHVGSDGEVNVYVGEGQTLSPAQIRELAKETHKMGASRVIVEENKQGGRGKSVDVSNPTPASLATKLRETFGENKINTHEVTKDDEGDTSFNFGANSAPENDIAASAQRYNAA